MITINNKQISDHIAHDVITKIIERKHRKSLNFGNNTKINLMRITAGFRGVWEQLEIESGIISPWFKNNIWIELNNIDDF